MRYINELIVLQILFITSGICLADEQKTNPPLKKQTKITHRLPNNYGKIGLSLAQKEKIYAVQDSYHAKIEALIKELETLRSQQNVDIQKVLTEEQKKELKKLLEATKKKRRLAKSKRELSKKKKIGATEK